MNGSIDNWQGDAFLVISNTVGPVAMREYEDWHRSEHVPERLTMPGFLVGRRYMRELGETSHFLTIYDIGSPDALVTPEYRHLLANPTTTSRRMRPLMGDFRRLLYRETGRYGAACGGRIGFLRWLDHDGRSGCDIAGLSELAGGGGIMGLRIGASQKAEAHPAFAPDTSLSTQHYAALLSAAGEAELRAALDRAVQLVDNILECNAFARS